LNIIFLFCPRLSQNSHVIVRHDCLTVAAVSNAWSYAYAPSYAFSIATSIAVMHTVTATSVDDP